MATVASEASDPRTSGARLQQICSMHPDLQATVANNPNAYPALLAWLGEYGTPRAKAVVAARNAEPVRPLVSEKEPEPTNIVPEPETVSAAEPVEDISEPEPQPDPEPETTDAVPEPQAESESELVEAFSEPELEPEPSAPASETEPDLTEVTLNTGPEPEPVENLSGPEPMVLGSDSEVEPAPETASSTVETELTEFTSASVADDVETETIALTDLAPPVGPAVPAPTSAQTVPGIPVQGTPPPPPARTSRMATPPTPTFAPVSSPPAGANQGPQRTSVFPATTQASGYTRAPGYPQTAGYTQTPAYTQPPPPSAQQAPAEQEKSPGVWLIPVAALVILIVAATLVWFFFFRSAPDQGASVLIPSETTQEAAEPEGDSEEATPVEENEEIEEAEQADESEIEEAEQDEPAPFPAPSNAVTATWFVSESANIACEMTSGAVTCTIYEHEYEVTSGGCSSGPITIVLGSGPAQWDCSRNPVSNTAAPVLEYSTSSTVDDFSCLSTAQGMSCWNHFTGDAFALAKAGWVDVRNNGVVTPSQMYWID